MSRFTNSKIIAFVIIFENQIGPIVDILGLHFSASKRLIFALNAIKYIPNFCFATPNFDPIPAPLANQTF
jgi:hypothetical protein